MRSARVQLFTYAVIGIACAHAFRQDAAHTTLAENRWVSWIWFVEDIDPGPTSLLALWTIPLYTAKAAFGS